MNPTARDLVWPPLLLALALACVVGFFLVARRNEPSDPIRPPARVEPATPVGLSRLTIEFLDIGQGDSALIRSPEGKLALIDAGPSNRVVKLLRARGVERLDLAVVTHHHADHYGGMLAVLKEFRPRVFLDAPSPHSSQHYEAILRAVRDSGMTAIQPTGAPRKIQLGSVLLTIFPQPPIDPRNENNNSIGLRVDFGDFSALLTGDSEVSERAWWREHAPDLVAGVSVLKLAHHGSRNGTDAAWLRLTRPSLAVASLGANNDFGHPHPETLRRLRAAGVPLDRTDQAGTVTIITDGQTWTETDSRAEPSTVDQGTAAGRSRRPLAGPGVALTARAA